MSHFLLETGGAFHFHVSELESNPTLLSKTDIRGHEVNRQFAGCFGADVPLFAQKTYMSISLLFLVTKGFLGVLCKLSNILVELVSSPARTKTALTDTVGGLENPRPALDEQVNQKNSRAPSCTDTADLYSFFPLSRSGLCMTKADHCSEKFLQQLRPGLGLRVRVWWALHEINKTGCSHVPQVTMVLYLSAIYWHWHPHNSRVFLLELHEHVSKVHQGHISAICWTGAQAFDRFVLFLFLFLKCLHGSLITRMCCFPCIKPEALVWAKQCEKAGLVFDQHSTILIPKSTSHWANRCPNKQNIIEH